MAAAPATRPGVAAPREPGRPPVSFDDTQPRLDAPRGLEDTQPRLDAPRGLEDTQPRHDAPRGLEDTQPRLDAPRGLEDTQPRLGAPRGLEDTQPRLAAAPSLAGDDSTAHTPIEAHPAPVHESTVRKDLLVGQRVGHYELRSRLGVGGMSVVYEAVEPLIGKRVAVKVLRPELSAEPRLVERLLAEARAVNAIRHRGIIDIYAFGTLNDGRPYVVMEYLEGQPLDEWLREKGSVSPLEVLPYLEELLGTLAAAHAAGVVHCDLKPGNVFLVHQPDGTRYVKVLDFGLAWRRVAGGALRAKGLEGLAAGTPDSMAPEQVRGEAPTPATDLYAVGVIAYTLLTGQRLFRGEGAEVMRQHATQPPRPMRQLQPALSLELDALVLSLLEKNPRDRPPSAEHVRQELGRVRRALELEALERRAGPPPTANVILKSTGSEAPPSARRRTDGKGVVVGEVGAGSEDSPSLRRRTDGKGVALPEPERPRTRTRPFAPGPELDEERVPVHPRAASVTAAEEKTALMGATTAAEEKTALMGAMTPFPGWSDATPQAREKGVEVAPPPAFRPLVTGEDDTQRATGSDDPGPLLPRWAWGLILLGLLGGLLLWWSTSPSDERPGLPEGDRRLLEFDRGTRPLR